MKMKIVSCVIVAILCIALFPINASADVGPKPSVIVDFDGLAGQTYYVTLLSDVKSTGPYSVYSSEDNNRYRNTNIDYPIFIKFIEYQDVDGFYFLQYFQNCSETHRFSWTYRPPEHYKILIYFPEHEIFAVADEVYENYAFDSYFGVSFEDSELSSAAENGTMSFSAYNSYDYTGEMASLLVRIVITVIVESLIALLFAFRNKKQLLFIVAVNLVTQIALNVALFHINFSHGRMMFVFSYLLFEFLVFAFEGVLCTVFFPKLSGTHIPRWRIFTYAFVANAVSFVLGLALAAIVPGLF